MSMDLDQAIQEDQLQEQAEVWGVAMVIVWYWALYPDPHRSAFIFSLMYSHSECGSISTIQEGKIKEKTEKCIENVYKCNLITIEKTF